MPDSLQTQCSERPRLLRILLLEDCLFDAELIQASLTEGGLDFECVRVDTRDAFLESLRRGAWNLILSDYSLPAFDGLAALELARAELPDVPFLFVSGAIGEERAIETLKHGATDYVLKDRLQRLVPSVQRALQDAAERALRDSEARTGAFLKNSAVIAWMTDESGRHVFLSENYKKRFKGRLDNWQGKSHFELWPKDVAERFRRSDLAVLATGKGREVTVEVVNPDGSQSWWFNSKFLFQDAAGKRYVGGLGVDITELRQTEAALSESELRFRRMAAFHEAVMNNMAEGLYAVDTQGIVTYINPAAEVLFGWSSTELLGRKMHDVMHYKHPDGTTFPSRECAGLQAIQDGVVLKERNDVFIRKDGTFFPVVYSASPLNVDGKTIGVVVAFRDDTLRRQAEEAVRVSEAALQQRVAELAEASRRKDEFLAMLAHELRNPLGAILNAANVIRHDVHDDQAITKAEDVIQRQSQHMTRLLDDLLDVARVTQGKIVLQQDLVDLATTVEDAVAAVQPRIMERHQDFSCEIAETPLFVLGDATRLEQILVNLLGNAVKYSPPGEHIRLTLSHEGNDVVIRVRDTGFGIAPPMLNRIFDLFVQSHQTIDRSEGGLGVGLTLVRCLAEMHGGQVTAHSEGLGHGSEFVVRLPSAPAPKLRPPRKRSTPRRSTTHRILIVEDNADSREMLKDLLELDGQEVRTAADGVQGLALVESGWPDLVLMDIGLPGLSGYDVARRIRANGHCETRLVALTGYGQPADRQAALEAGFDDHLVKPITPAELRRVLSQEPTQRSLDPQITGSSS